MSGKRANIVSLKKGKSIAMTLTEVIYPPSSKPTNMARKMKRGVVFTWE